MTRTDARDFLALAHEIGIRPRVRTFSLDEANDALDAVKHETADGPCVIFPHSASAQHDDLREV
jgi:propanol-preferring alcohol dehydrogenase